MAGHFPLYTDADVYGPLVSALKRNGWDVLRAVEAFPEGTKDRPHFERAAELGRVLVSNDADQLVIAVEWAAAGRRFPGLVTWPQKRHETLNVGLFLELFEGLAAQEEPFPPAYPIRFLTPPRA